MDGGSVSELWAVIQAIFGPLAPVVGAAAVVWAIMTRVKGPEESQKPMTRGEGEKLEARLHDIEASVNQIKGALGIK